MLNRKLLAVVYGITALLGLLTVLFPVPSIWGVLGLHITYLYGILLILGGVGALIAVLKPNYKAELIWLVPVAGGYLLYDVALWVLFAERLGIVDGLAPPYGPALAVLVLSIFLFAKILFLAKKNSELVRASDNERLD